MDLRKIRMFRALITFSLKSSAGQAAIYNLWHPLITRKMNGDDIPNDFYIK